MPGERKWFKNKLYGYGWTPHTWEGWLVTLIYIAILLTSAVRVDERNLTDKEVLIVFSPVFVLSTVVLVAIAVWKGEKPEWHWGKKKE